MAEQRLADPWLPAIPLPAPVDGLPVPLAPFRLLRSEEAAELMGLPSGTLRSWRSRGPGHGPRAVMLGAAVRYRHADLENWFNAGPGGGGLGQFLLPPMVRPLNQQEAALLLAVSQATLRTWRSRRAPLSPPAFVHAGLIRYSAPNLIAWMEDMVEGPDGSAPPAVASGRVPLPMRGRARRKPTD